MSSDGDSENNLEDEYSNESTHSEIEDSADIAKTERLKIREKLCTLSFEDLLKMKEQIGSKLYNETVFGSTKRKRKTDFKRANKNRPREMSSKIKPYKKNLINNNNISVHKNLIPRDPRFDPLCGQFDDKSFKSNYKFVNEIRHTEVKQLEEELKICKDPERKKTIKMLLQRMNNQIREQQKRDAENKKIYEEKKEIREKLMKGEKPVFKKKSIKKLENLIEKYEELKKTNKLQKHIEKRSRKLSVKEKKKLKN